MGVAVVVADGYLPFVYRPSAERRADLALFIPTALINPVIYGPVGFAQLSVSSFAATKADATQWGADNSASGDAWLEAGDFFHQQPPIADG